LQTHVRLLATQENINLLSKSRRESSAMPPAET